jgi:hypothetical protein
MAHNEGWFGNVNAGMARGFLMMFIAVAWFGVGYFAMERIFFYPPILFLIGLVSFGKGIFTNE